MANTWKKNWMFARPTWLRKLAFTAHWAAHLPTFPLPITIHDPVAILNVDKPSVALHAWPYYTTDRRPKSWHLSSSNEFPYSQIHRQTYGLITIPGLQYIILQYGGTNQYQIMKKIVGEGKIVGGGATGEEVLHSGGTLLYMKTVEYVW